MTTHAISRDGMTGLRLLDVTNQQVHDKFNQMSVTYEMSPSMFVSGEVDTDISIQPAEGEYLTVTQDSGTLELSTDFQGTVNIFPPAANNSLWHLVDVLVPLDTSLAKAPGVTVKVK